MQVGQEINDGSVRWIVRDSRAIATTSTPGLMSAADKQALETLKNATGYTLPIANSTTIGGVKTASNSGIIVTASGVVSLAAASTSGLGGIKLAGGTTKFLRSDGTWALPSAAISVFSRTTAGLVPAYNSDQKDMFLTSGGWRELHVNYPSQLGTLTYDGTDQQPEWPVSEDQVAFATVAATLIAEVRPNIASLASDGSDGRAKVKVFSATHGTNAGYYVVKVTPEAGHIWSGSSKFAEDVKYTSLPVYTFWKIKKAPNLIDINAKKFSVSYDEDVEIPYDTEDDSKVNVILPEFKYNANDVAAGLQWANQDAYYKIKNTVDAETGQKKLIFTRLDIPKGYDNKSGGGLKASLINPTITLQSADSYNYYAYPTVTTGKKAMKIQFVHTLAPSIFALSDIDEINSAQSLELNFTSSTETKILKFSYKSSKAPQISIVSPNTTPAISNTTSYYPPIKIQSVEDLYLESVEKYKANQGANPTYTNKNVYISTGGSFTLKHADGTSNTTQVVGDIVHTSAGMDQNYVQWTDRPNSK